MPYHLVVLENSNQWTAFIDLPWKIYQNLKYWVPPLRVAVRDSLDIRKNPFFKHARMYPILVYQGSTCVGRSVGVVDDNHNRFHNEKTAFFGFFECIEDERVARLLLDEMLRWARTQGMNNLRGPASPSMNHECGLLVEGFDDYPSIMMNFNPPYYAHFFENWGLKKVKDLYAYEVIRQENGFSERLIRQSDRLKQRGSVTFRTLKMKNFSAEITRILEIYNDAWEKNWGFVPWEEEEFRHMAKDLKLVIEPELCLLAEIRGEPVAFALILPDVNQVLKKLRSGRLTPWNLIKLLWHLKGPGKKKTMNRCRIVTLGIKKAYREYGIGPLFYTEFLKRGPDLGYPIGEASWVLEDNRPMNRAMQLMQGKRTKVYRIYDKSLS